MTRTTFGQIAGVNLPARQMQLALKCSFSGYVA
jgi:hypothetical protein